MTINEQLQFSVLTAPVACIDRRTLSQAWYSALYGNGSAALTPSPASSGELHATYAAEKQSQIVPHDPSRTARTATKEPPALKTPAHAEGTPQDRRAPRSALARKIERAFLRPRSASHKTSFTLEGTSGRVHVVLHTQGTQLKLVAICPPKARADVAAALRQARYALALRGIELSMQTRESAPC